MHPFFKNIKFEGRYSFVSIYDQNSIIEAIEEAEEKSDALLFTGKLIYEMSLYLCSPKKPWYYIEHEKVDLYRNIMEASIGKGVGVEKISSDCYNYKELKSICDDIGINPKIDRSLLINYKYEDNFHVEIINIHKSNYRSGRAKLIFTYLSDVYEALLEVNIPCIHVKPSRTSIFNTLNEMVIAYENSQKLISNNAVISIEVDKVDKFSNNQKFKQLKEIKKKLVFKNSDVLFYSSLSGDGKEELLDFIGKTLEEYSRDSSGEELIDENGEK